MATEIISNTVYVGGTFTSVSGPEAPSPVRTWPHSTPAPVPSAPGLANANQAVRAP
ncbi:MAG: hypothetical protein IPF42_14570 [Candidatus Microthrix sp.]|nr:hypothetical protein [Candidatus Microthrix sp.]